VLAEYTYPGSELDVFAAARRWKRYWSRYVAPYVRGRVLDVGAGIGSNLRFLIDRTTRWVCVEPDPALAGRLEALVAGSEWRNRCVVRHGTLESLPDLGGFDTILYIDVLEHIPDDAGELRRAAAALAAGGHLIVLSPAYPWLYSEFDAAVGHCRRYTTSALRELTPSGLRLLRVGHLDSLGILASAMNRVLLRRATPSPEQIATWDRWLVPASIVADRCSGYTVGRSIIGIWRREP
jgi:SAM-dependent methyltransferase